MATPMYDESFYSDLLARSLNAKREAITPVGRVDVLTSAEVIEVKFVRGWKNALGQVLAYGLYYPTKGKRIHLLGNPSQSEQDLIEITCAKFSVRVTWQGLSSGFESSLTTVETSPDQLPLDSVETFIDSSLRPDPSSPPIDKRDLHDRYFDYCQQFGLEPLHFMGFCKRMRQLLGRQYETRPTSKSVAGSKVNIPSMFRSMEVSINNYKGNLPLFTTQATQVK